MKIETSLIILVLDDHEAIRRSSIEALQGKYPEAKILSAINVEEALVQVELYQPSLLIADLAIPTSTKDKEKATAANGVAFLKTLMQNQENLNIVVVSSYPEAVIRLKSDIENYEGGGFTVASKNAIADLLKKAEWALEGIIHTRDVPGMRSGDFKPEWLTVLQFAYQEGLEDKAIAKRMHVSLRTARYYWSNIYDVLGVYPEEGVNLRILTEKKAREIGLID